MGKSRKIRWLLHCITSKMKPPLQVERDTNPHWAGGRRTAGEWQSPPITSGRVHQCPHCAYNTNDSFKLRRHILKHTGERPFSCPYCSYGTTRKELLKEHINVHTGEKPYNCPHCPYSASQRSCLNVHLRRHAPNERSFTCPYCPFKTFQKSKLNTHVLTHKAGYHIPWGKENLNWMCIDYLSCETWATTCISD